MVANEDGGAFIEIDPKKLGLKGHELLGGVKTLLRWVEMLTSMKEASENVQERVFLAEIITALQTDADLGKVELAKLAMSRGAGKQHDVEDDAEPN